LNEDDAMPPEGVAPEILEAALASLPDGTEEDGLGCDAYALWAAMTRLGHEVKLQGRSFAALRERLEDESAFGVDAIAEDAGEKIAAVVVRALSLFRESDREAERRAEAARRQAARSEDELLSILADLHDRLARGLDAARRQRSFYARKQGWLARILSRRGKGPEIVASLVEGQELALSHIGDELSRRGMREIAALGEPFEPDSMRVVATDASGRAEDGIVTEVIRGGWFRGETVWRSSEVVVARRGQQHEA